MTGKSARRDGRRSRWDDHRVARRQELIAATVLAVRQLGPDVGMDDISGHAKVSKPVFYRYFTDKADLHLAVGHSVAEAVVRQVNRALDVEAPVRHRVAAGIDCYLRLIAADPELYAFVVHGSPPRRGAHAGLPAADPVEDYATVVGIHASRLLGGALREAGADAAAAEPWGFGVVGMVRSAADRWLEHPTMSREDLVAYLTDLVAPGLSIAIPDRVALTS